MAPVTRLRPGQTLRRRVGRLVIEIDFDGITIRGHGRRTRHRVTWLQLATLAAERHPLFDAGGPGRELLTKMGVDLKEVSTSDAKDQATRDTTDKTAG